MFGPKGNPQARNLFRIIGLLQKQEGLRLKVDVIRLWHGVVSKPMTNWNTCPAVEPDPRKISGARATDQAAAWSR